MEDYNHFHKETIVIVPELGPSFVKEGKSVAEVSPHVSRATQLEAESATPREEEPTQQQEIIAESPLGRKIETTTLEIDGQGLLGPSF